MSFLEAHLEFMELVIHIETLDPIKSVLETQIRMTDILLYDPLQNSLNIV